MFNTPVVTYILDDDGQPVREPDIAKWGRWMETANRQIAVEMIGEVRISTVFLGLDHNHSGEGPPILFETMIFGHDSYMNRYATKEQALAGHRDAVAMAIADKSVEKYGDLFTRMYWND